MSGSYRHKYRLRNQRVDPVPRWMGKECVHAFFRLRFSQQSAPPLHLSHRAHASF
jgi:hypothetical protein